MSRITTTFHPHAPQQYGSAGELAHGQLLLYFTHNNLLFHVTQKYGGAGV